MPSLRRSCAFFLLVIAPVASAKAQVKTDAELDGLAGPVKSVSSATTTSGIKWEQPGGPLLIAPVWCKECEYDPDGTKTKSGQMVEGKFWGELLRIVRGADGQVTERFSYSSSTGELQRRDVMGAFGKIEQRVYSGGKLRSRSTFAYDQYGHLSDWSSFNPAGKSLGHTSFVTAKDGTKTRTSSYGPNGELTWEQTFDPETQTDHFLTFDESGNVKLTWTVIRGKLASFWQPHDSPPQFGDNFSEPEGEGSVDNFSCHSDLRCDVSHVHFDYLDGDKHTPSSAEWRDADGNLKLAAYFEYDVDSFRNWTFRRVWVWTPDLGQEALYETDFRVITYWK